MLLQFCAGYFLYFRNETSSLNIRPGQKFQAGQTKWKKRARGEGKESAFSSFGSPLPRLGVSETPLITPFRSVFLPATHHKMGVRHMGVGKREVRQRLRCGARPQSNSGSRATTEEDREQEMYRLREEILKQVQHPGPTGV